MKKNKKKGFTLIELVAVIAILAILAVALVPQVSKYIEKSKKTAIQAQCREIVTVVEAYNAEAGPGEVIISFKQQEILLAYVGGGISLTAPTDLEGILKLEKIQELLGAAKASGTVPGELSKKFNKIPLSTTYVTIKAISEGANFNLPTSTSDGIATTTP